MARTMFPFEKNKLEIKIRQEWFWVLLMLNQSTLWVGGQQMQNGPIAARAGQAAMKLRRGVWQLWHPPISVGSSVARSLMLLAAILEPISALVLLGNCAGQNSHVSSPGCRTALDAMLRMNTLARLPAAIAVLCTQRLSCKVPQLSSCALLMWRSAAPSSVP